MLTDLFEFYCRHTKKKNLMLYLFMFKLPLHIEKKGSPQDEPLSQIFFLI